MRERSKQRQQKIRTNQWWTIGAIAAPVFLWIVWWSLLLPGRGLQPADGRLVHAEQAPPAHPPRETPINGIGAIATIAGGVLLILNFRIANRQVERANFSNANLSGTDFSGNNLTGADLSGANLSDANLSSADLSGADLSGADLRYANLSGANLSGADLIRANLSGTDLNGANLRYANLSEADLISANLSDADLRYANLSGADLNCAFLNGANLSDANLSGALMFFINSRDVLNLEPFQLQAEPSPFLCNVALPSYSNHPDVNPNRDCSRIPQLLSTRYDISLEEAQGIVDEARQHRWD